MSGVDWGVLGLVVPSKSGAGDGSRTRDNQLGRLELYQLSYSRGSCVFLSKNSVVEGEGFEPSKPVAPDLQSGPFDRSGTPPKNGKSGPGFVLLRCFVVLSWGNLRRAGDGTRTRNLLITNQLLYQLSYASAWDCPCVVGPSDVYNLAKLGRLPVRAEWSCRPGSANVYFGKSVVSSKLRTNALRIDPTTLLRRGAHPPSRGHHHLDRGRWQSGCGSLSITPWCGDQRMRRSGFSGASGGGLASVGPRSRSGAAGGVAEAGGGAALSSSRWGRRPSKCSLPSGSSSLRSLP